MKIDDIEAFVAMVRCQSISQAARELGLTQPSITRRLQNLEENLGAQLLDRQTKPPKPTDLGWRVHTQCLEILRQVDALHEISATDLTPSGSIRLGLTQGIGEVAALAACQQLRTTWPQLKPLIATGSGGSILMERVERDELDAAILFLPQGAQVPRNLEGTQLAQSQLVIVGRQGEWPAKRYDLTVCNARGWILNPDGCGFRAGLKRALAAKNLPLLVNLDSYGRDLQLQCVAEGLGLGLIPLKLLQASPWQSQVQTVPVSEFKPLINLWLITGKPLGMLAQPVQQFGQIVGDYLR